MKYQKISIIVISFFFLPGIFFPRLSWAQQIIDPDFNPNKIIEDGELLNYSSMNLTDIQNFLQNKGSFLANYIVTSTNGVLKSASQIIYDATNNNFDCDGVTLSASPTEAEKSAKCRHITTVNPKLILVLLQKEESLIEDSNPSQTHLDWATGYGCPDSWVCNPYYKGFGKQVNSAALQFLAYMNEPQPYYKKAGQTYIAKDKYSPLKTPAEAISSGNYNDIISSPDMVSVIPQNQATAALYSYTPHIFNGNYNFYQLWNRYFPKISRLYPNGSIIQAQGDPRIWLIENGRKRHFTNWSAFTSRFNPDQVVTVTSSDLDNYPTGDDIKFANYSVVQIPDKTIFLLVDKQKRPFASSEVFKKIGFNPAEIEAASLTDLAGYQTGSTITATSTYITGALLQDNKTGDIYYIQNNTKALVDKILLPIKFSYQKIIKTTAKELNNYATTTPILLNEGTLVRTTSFPTIYLISDGKKRPFADDVVFTGLGYNYDNVIAVSSQFLYNYDKGAPIE
ncbi:MAG: hypothetical protein WC249_00990 [Patescibacteria group bacterium]|jgi:hypothetical protein